MTSRRTGWATLQDVARVAGVSHMTVSNAVKQPHRVADATRRRVLEAARRLGYVPNQVAGDLASGRSNVIVATVPSLSNAYFYALIEGVMDALRDRGYQLMMADTGYDPEEEQRTIESFLRRRPDGLILTGTRHTRRTVELLRTASVPVVETWETQGPFIDMGIGYSHFDASARLTERLLAQGHRAVGFIDHPASAARRHGLRRDGIRHTLLQAGLTADRVVELPTVAGFGGGRAGLAEIVQRWPEVTAVIAATDVYAAGALFECQRRGIDVPGDLVLCGFGNAEVGRETCPPITTVDTLSRAMGKGAAEFLLAALDGQRPSATVRDVGFAILERESTGRCRRVNGAGATRA